MTRKIICTGAIAIVLAATIGLSWLLLTPRWVYQVSVEGQSVGVVRTLKEYEQIIEDIQSKAEARWGCDLIMNEEITATRVRLWSPELTPEEIRARLEAIATYQTRGWAIVVNGATVAIVDREGTARDILEEVQTQYISQAKNSKLVSVSLQEDVCLEGVAVTPDVVMDKQSVLTLLACGGGEKRTYVVKSGDTLSGISRSNNVPLVAIREANAITGDTIQIGQILNLETNQALLHVKTVETVSATELIARAVKYKVNPDSSVRGDTVVESGADGKRSVEYEVVSINGSEVSRKKIAAVVTKEPQAKIIMTGIGYWPARPKGIFRFPVNGGNISSLFGAYRDHGSHLGLDIANPRGTPVYAAASGTITAKTRNSSYGMFIAIKHANGYSTLYAHLSQFASTVRVGGSVVRGQLIGRVGNSGRSTGPHLHWEVRRNGAPLNPLNFFGN